MKNKAKSLIAILLLLAVLLIEPLHLNIVTAQQSITGTQDDTFGVWLFNAGTTVPAGAPTDDIIERAIFYDLLDYIGDSSGEVYDWDYGLSEPTAGQEDTTLPEVLEGLSAIDDFGMIANSGDDAANFDTGSGGYFEGGFDLALAYVIYPDGIKADGVVGPDGAVNAQEAEEAIEGYEIFIFEDAELSGMIITLSNKLGLSISITLDDLQVDPPTPNAADDTMIAIDLDSMTGFDGTYIDKIRIQDDGITQSRTDTGDTTLEIDAIATRTVECTVNFYTDPVGSSFNITFEGSTYVNGDSDTFPYGTSGSAYADCPPGWVFDHWEIVGNVALDPDEYANPVTFTITCGGDLKAVFREEGTGDFGTIGYWKHVFYVWKVGKGTFKDYVESILEGYIARINAESTVFSENFTLTMESAHDLLWTRDNDMRTRALKQCLASWLNWADNAVTPSQMVDIDYDGHPDMTFGDAMTIVENILRNPDSSREELEHAKNICDSINNM